MFLMENDSVSVLRLRKLKPNFNKYPRLKFSTGVFIKIKCIALLLIFLERNR